MCVSQSVIASIYQLDIYVSFLSISHDYSPQFKEIIQVLANDIVQVKTRLIINLACTSTYTI